MTTKPTVPASRAGGYTVTGSDYSSDVCQSVNYLFELASGTNTDKIPTAAIVVGPNFTGLVGSSGTGAGFSAADRLTPFTATLAWFRSGTTLSFYSSDGGTLWSINATTGLLTQAALSALASRGTNISATDAAGFAPSGSRRVLPGGNVYGQIALAVTGTITAGAVLATIASGHAPTSGTQVLWMRRNSTIISGYINTSGQISADVGMVNADSLVATFSYFIS